MSYQVTRIHDFSCGHRVVGHEGKCKDLHGHNYRAHLTVGPSSGTESLDSVGRVIDFAVIKTVLCAWIEDTWDHQFLVWNEDPLLEAMRGLPGICVVPFNPTAENMAAFLVEHVGPIVLTDEVQLIACTLEETRKCSATVTI